MGHILKDIQTHGEFSECFVQLESHFVIFREPIVIHLVDGLLELPQMVDLTNSLFVKSTIL